MKRGFMQDNLWQAVLGEIEVSVSRASFVTWFKNTSLIKHDREVITVGVPNIFIKQQLERKFNKLIEDTLARNGVKPRQIEYKIHSVKQTKRLDDDAIVVSAPPKTRTKASQSSLSHSYRQGLNEKYTFDSFIVGSGNELAYAACQAIAANPGKKYNPLFVYGGVGIGKTHLIQAVGNAVLANKPGAHIVYVSTEQFVQEFVDAVRFKKNTDFAGYYRSADVLIVDDIQFIAGREKTQEEFFHTFNALYSAKHQIVITSDKLPQEIPGIEERLQTRFAWGLTADIQAPDFETRVAILNRKASLDRFDLPADVAHFIAENVSSNVRELEGALTRLHALCSLQKVEITLELAESALRPLLKKKKVHVTIEEIQKVVA
ncbi:chromosomal replication initiator protein DnaA, partial [Candidatus Saccharibacteria bacterium]|nr:chromosomal replication initiator protein DnaA [Candidatus Saccharibacteria bacterium]